MSQRKVSVCGRVMTMLTDDAAVASPGANAPHTSYALDRPEIARELSAFRELIATPAIRQSESVMEMFGGSGWHAASIQDIVAPRRHLIKDIAPSCVESIALSFPEAGVEVSQGDSFAFARDGFGGEDFDLIHADFNQYTPMRGEQDKLYKGVLEQIFKRSKLAIVTDSAVYGVSRFERNREAYARFFDRNITNVSDYYHAANDWYVKKHGRVIKQVVVWSNMSSMYVLGAGRKASGFEIKTQFDKADVRLLEE
jgi:hypothetical protein